MAASRGGRARTAPKGKIRHKGAGVLEQRNGHWWVRVSLPDGTGPRYRLCGFTCDCDAMSEARRLDRAEAISERERKRVAAEMAERSRLDASKRLAVRDFGELWTSGKLYEQHGDVNGLRPKATAKNDAYRLRAYVYPEIGDKAVADVTEQDVERVMREAEKRARKRLGRPWRKASRFQVYQVMRRLFDLAVRPGRLRTDSPVSKRMRPGHDDQKLFGYLYPSEVVGVLGCKRVEVARRVLYAMAVYTGLRKGSLLALRWNAVDFEHGTLTSLKSKNGLPQMFEIPRSLVAVLAGWYESQGRPEQASAIVTDLGCRPEREAEQLRTDLEAAGVKREALFSRASNVEPIRFHDLRATFVTWAMREGRGDGWISDRTGHLTPAMRERYARAARTLMDLKYEPFPDISKAIPELLDKRDNVRALATARRRQKDKV